MRSMSEVEVDSKPLSDIISAHTKWAEDANTGSRADLRGADLRSADFRGANLRGANLSGANLSGADLDYSCLPLWCGGKFKADVKICKQLVAHVVRIMELSEIDNPELITMMNDYKSGWRREVEF